MVRGLERPPAWAIVVMMLATTWLIGGSALAAQRVDSPQSTSSALASEPEPTRILVIGDSYTGGSDEGGNGGAGWPMLVEAALLAAGHDVTVDVSAAGGSGYVAVGPGGKSLVQLAQVTAVHDVVVFFGSRNDTASAEEVQAAAGQAFTAIKATSPDAALLVIGPPWVNDEPPSSVLNASVGVEDAATAVGATFVDPLDEGWFADRPDLIGADGVHPTDEGHRYLADLIRPTIEVALAQ